MTVVNQNFRMWKGDTKNITVPVLDGDGNPVDLTGDSIVWEMKCGLETLTKDTEGGGITISTEGDKNEFTVLILPADTENFVGVLFYHEAELTDAGGNVSTVLTGIAAVRDQLIKAAA